MELFNFEWSNGTKSMTITNFKHIRKRNLEEYDNDPDINIKRRWGIHTNGAKKGNPKHSCLDWQLDLGHIHLNYMDWNYNKKYKE